MAKCSECGFLCHRDTTTAELVELHYKTRDAGQVLFTHHGGETTRWPVVCFVRERKFPDFQQPTEIMSTITAEIACPKFTPWAHGFSPKEHFQMLQMDEMRRWQKEMSDQNQRHNSRCALIQGGATILAALTSVFLSAIFAYVMSRK